MLIYFDAKNIPYLPRIVQLPFKLIPSLLAFWHNKMFQAHFELSLPCPQDEPYLQRALVPLSGSSRPGLHAQCHLAHIYVSLDFCVSDYLLKNHQFTLRPPVPVRATVSFQLFLLPHLCLLALRAWNPAPNILSSFGYLISPLV